MCSAACPSLAPSSGVSPSCSRDNVGGIPPIRLIPSSIGGIRCAKREALRLFEQGFLEGRHASSVFPADTANVIDIEDRNQAENGFNELLYILPQYLWVYGADEKPVYANDSA